jgi:outer membrane protein
MKKLLLVIAVVFVGVVSAQKTVHYDYDKVIKTYSKAIEAEKKLEQFQQDYAANLKQMEQSLQQKQATLQQNQATMQEWELQSAQAEFESIYNTYMQAQQTFQERYVAKQTELLTPIMDEINVVLEEIANAKGYDYIILMIDAKATYANPKYDITEMVIQKLEASLPAAN